MPGTVWKCCAGMYDPYSTSARGQAQSSIIRFTSLTSPTTRNMISASHRAGTTLAAVPPRNTPMLAVVSPSTRSDGRARVRSPGRRSSIGSMAEEPRWGEAEGGSRARGGGVARGEGLGVGLAAAGAEGDAERALGAARQTTLGRLAVDQKAAGRRE